MSGGLRRQAGLTKARVQRYIQELPPPIKHEGNLPVEEQLRYYNEQLELVEYASRRITAGVKCLENLSCEWNSLIERLSPEERPAEEKIYDEYLDDKGSFLHVLENGREAIDLLETQKVNISNMITRLNDRSQLTTMVLAPSVTENNLKLPKLELKHFHGDTLLWPEFWANFQASVDAQNIPEIQKLSYLMTCLKGRAYSAVAGYAMTPENYQTILGVLKRRFGDPEALKRQLYTELRKLPTMDQTKNPRNTLENLERILRQLENIGENIEQPQIEMAIEEKLNRWILYELYDKKMKTDAWSVKAMREALEEIVQKREKVNLILEEKRLSGRKEYPRPDNIEVRTKIKEVTESSALTTVAKGSWKDREPMCSLCQKQHKSNECQKFKTRESRMERIKELKLCFKCLRGGHRAKACRSKLRPCFLCQGKHHTALCPDSGQKNESEKVQTVAIPEPVHEYDHPSVTITSISERKEGTIQKKEEAETVLLMSKEVTVRNPERKNKSRKATVLVDFGSQKSFVLESLSKELQLHGEQTEKLAVAGFGAKQSKEYISKRVTVGIELANGEMQELKCQTVSYITQSLKTVNVSPDIVQTLVTQKNLPTLPVSWKEPEILIGIDYAFQFMKPLETFNLPSGFQLLNTALGLMMAGKGHLPPGTEKQARKNQVGTIIVGVANDEKEDISNFWTLESIGIDLKQEDDEDQLAREQFKNSVQRIDGRYSVSWPWKTMTPQLKSNFGLALGRLKSALKRLRAKPVLLDQYLETFKSQLEKDIIEEVKGSDTRGIVYYLPHQPVITPHKNTTKLRIVFDASAKAGNGKSLNDVLRRGPVMLPSLVGVLLRWRTMKTAIICDIEKAFLQVQLNEPDRDCCRFLWVKDPEKEPEGINLVKYRFKRVPFGIISSPFMLAMTIEKHLTEDGSTLAQGIKQNLYVDNILVEAISTTDALQKYKEIKELFAKAQMNVREFLANDEEFNRNIPMDDRYQGHPKVLGLRWDHNEDQIILSIHDCVPVLQTKRKVLQFIAAHYDPLGFLCPIFLPLKLFLQGLWKRERKWDEIMQESEQEEMKRILQGWAKREYKIPRYPLAEIEEIHCFVDASERAYAAAVYVIGNSEKGKVSSLVYAKSRICPMKPLTIPRLELLAVVIGIRAMNFVKNELRLQSPITLWSDSQCVLKWIQNPKEKSDRFVENRLIEIRRSNATFRYVPTQHNPADIATRGSLPQELENNDLWWQGPEWLRGEKQYWPVWNLGTRENEVSVNLTTTITEKGLIELEQFSSWKKLRGVMAYVLRFIENAKNKKRETVSAEDYSKAEIVLIHYSQQNDEEKEEQKKWRVFEDGTGILRCSSRLLESDLPNQTLLPIYLPRKSHLTKLIIMNVHTNHYHSGAAHTLTQLRGKYWLPKGRATVRKVIHDMCMVCRKWNARPFQLPCMPSYPGSRVLRSRVFQKVGLDYLGPVTVKEGTKHSKRWIALFTCFSTRAVHLEVVDDLAAKTFINCLRRYIARRGCPEEILSDNGSQFLLSRGVVDEAWSNVLKDPEILNYTRDQKIQWHTITPRAPWKGGAYERLVGLTKFALRKAIGRQLIDVIQLQTYITEIEGILNARPLTYLNEDSIKVIRPIDFIAPEVQLGTPQNLHEDKNDDDYVPKESSRQVILKWWNKTNENLDKFWQFWQQDYLTFLRERTQSQHKSKSDSVMRAPKIGEAVLIQDEELPRGCWKIGRIIELIEGKENQIRSARVQTPNRKVLTRPINFLLPLEISSEYEDERVTKTDGEKAVNVQHERNENKAGVWNLRNRQVPKILTALNGKISGTKSWPFYVFVIFVMMTTGLTSAETEMCSFQAYQLEISTTNYRLEIRATSSIDEEFEERSPSGIKLKNWLPDDGVPDLPELSPISKYSSRKKTRLGSVAARRDYTAIKKIYVIDIICVMHHVMRAL